MWNNFPFKYGLIRRLYTIWLSSSNCSQHYLLGCFSGCKDEVFLLLCLKILFPKPEHIFSPSLLSLLAFDSIHRKISLVVKYIQVQVNFFDGWWIWSKPASLNKFFQSNFCLMSSVRSKIFRSFLCKFG